MINEMIFKIEPNSPQTIYYSGQNIIRLSDAIHSIFPTYSDKKATLHWGEEEILLSYDEDISVMINDVVEMILTLLCKNAGEWSVDFSSYTFAVNWHLTWEDDFLQITAQWRDEFDASDYLKNNNVIKVKKSSFINEWRKIFEILHTELEASELKPKNFVDIKVFYKVCDLLARKSITH